MHVLTLRLYTECVQVRRNIRAHSVGVDRVWFGSQAFRSASAFNVNIVAWNTASLTGLTNVCAAFRRRRAPQRKRWSSMRRGAIDVAHTYIVV